MIYNERSRADLLTDLKEVQDDLNKLSDGTFGSIKARYYNRAMNKLMDIIAEGERKANERQLQATERQLQATEDPSTRRSEVYTKEWRTVVGRPERLQWGI